MNPANENPKDFSKVSANQRLAARFGDFERGLGQEMYFLGLDVIHPKGNLLLRYGFKKRPSPTGRGTSCYHSEFNGYNLELYGSCIGLSSHDVDGMLYVRPRRRIFLRDFQQTLIPGCWDQQKLDRGDTRTRYHISCQLIEWILDYRNWLRARLGAHYRQHCDLSYKNRPPASRWLPPPHDEAWWQQFLSNPLSLPNLRTFKKQTQEPCTQTTKNYP